MDPQEEEDDVPVQRVPRQRRASHPPPRDLFTAHREEMNRAFDAFQRDIWADPLIARSQLAAHRQTQRRLSTANRLFESFLDDGPLFRPPFEAPRLSIPSRVKNIHIHWFDDADIPARPRAQSSSRPRIEDVTSSTDPHVLNIAPQQHVCVVEMPSAVESNRIPNSNMDTSQRNSFNPNAPVITYVSTDIHDE